MRIDRRTTNAKRSYSHNKTAEYEIYLRNRKRLLDSSDNLMCHLCGCWIDKSLKYPHKMAFTADHVIPVSKGGSVTGELLPAHNSCNAARKDEDINKIRARQRGSVRAW